MKNIFTILLLLYVGNNLLLAQTPVLPTKDIANTPSNLLFKPNSEDDLPHNVMGLTFTGVSGHGTYVDNSVRIYKTATVNEQYFWVYTNSTGKSFNPISGIDNPNGNYTIEFKAKITNNSGRGIDVVIRDAVSQSPTFNFGSANILVRYSSSNIVTITDNNYTGAIERAYTIAVERGVYNNSDQRNKYHIYADGNYLGTAEGSGNNANYYLQIGHANGAQTIDANIYYVAVDYAGAYKPETVKPLPVSLVDYSVKKNLNTAQLDWETATELNNSHFEIERSTDGINFLKISEIPAKGVGKYSFVDHTPINGINYYRLTQYDLNGTKTDLGVKDINFDIENKSISVFPIPAKIGASIYIEANYPYTFYDFELLDVSGKILLKEPKYINKEKAELKLPDNIKPGVYILKIGKTESRKVLVGL